MARMNQVILEGTIISIDDVTFTLDIDDTASIVVQNNGVVKRDLLHKGNVVRVIGKLRDVYVQAEHIEKVR